MPWKGSAAVGVTLTRGNSDTLLATASAVAGKKWAHDELSFGADGTYGETKDQTTGENTVNANSIHGFAQYNRLFTDRFFGYARTEALHDEVADVRYRVSLSPGAGYYFIKETNIDLCAEVGPGYVWERLGTNDSSFATLRLGEKFRQLFQLVLRQAAREVRRVLPDDVAKYADSVEFRVTFAACRTLLLHDAEI